MLQRWLAAMLMVVFSISSFESLIADTHDGDAPAPGAVIGTSLEIAQCVAPQAGDAPSAVAERPIVDCGTHPKQSHDLHVCHCTHAHVVTLSMVPTLTVALVSAVRGLPWLDVQAPASADRALPLRPPVRTRSA